MTNITKHLDAETQVEGALAKLSLGEKVQLLTGHDFWSTVPIESIGLRAMVISDGPSGVRGPVWDERSPSLNLPSASALSAAFDPDLARRYGAVAAVEARRKSVDVVLGPTVNLHRSPLGGRHFEAFSEDPVLTAQLAAAYVTGVQDNGVGAAPKHYVANDSETERFTVDVEVDERPLRELYLLAFEQAIIEARAWLVMSAYNSVNGTTATENPLLEAPLNSEWGFDGVVISDWTAVRSLTAAKAAQDLVMPGPDGPWGEALVAAVREGRIPEAAVDRKVRRILRLAQRVGALGDNAPAPLILLEDGPSFARTAAAAGMVLLENRGELPWDPARIASVAVVGNNAAVARTQGGGSATVLPPYTVSPLEGLRAALPDADIRYALGATTQVGLTGIPRDQMTNPVTGEAGARITFRNATGEDIFSEDRYASELLWFDGAAPISSASQVEIAFRYRPARTERVDLGFAATGHGRLWINGALLIDEMVYAEGEDLGAALLSPGTRSVPVDLIEGDPVDIRFLYEPGVRGGGLGNALSLNVGTRPTWTDEDALIAEAAATAAAAEVALVVVGTNERVESEGFDRGSLALPGRQDDLIRAVAAANHRTVVLVNAGAPVLMPWRHDVAAVLVGWFGGQEFGNAVADVLLGVAEPGGRLPTTWPDAEADVPVLETRPVEGKLRYDEGIHIGYRAWLRAGAAPAYWFGHGHGYAEVTVTQIVAPPSATQDDFVDVEVTVSNQGSREGKQVVLLFAEKHDSAVDRPVRWLIGFAPVHAGAGATAVVAVRLSTRLLAYWSDGWRYETGAYTIRAGTTAVDLPVSAGLELRASN